MAVFALSYISLKSLINKQQFVRSVGWLAVAIQTFFRPYPSSPHVLVAIQIHCIHT